MRIGSCSCFRLLQPGFACLYSQLRRIARKSMAIIARGQIAPKNQPPRGPVFRIGKAEKPT
jgi:hypothetical protein